ncbi:putative conserved secreted protein [Synechococcus sp. BOUM118]|nr:putative conserved secreted protein [Synechococcus sp. BOUM118]
MERRVWMLLIGLTILLSGGPAWAESSLEQRLNSWPDWSLPAPLPRPSNRDDLIYPDWFEGLWQVEGIDLDAPGDSPLLHQALFERDRRGRLVGDRSFNATAIGRALLGDQLLRVEDDPDSANRQIARLKGDLYLETTVTGRRQDSPTTDTFLSDELVLQILHTPGAPRLSRIETLSRYSRCDDDICAEQWQGRYASPGESLRDQAIAHHHYRLRFTLLPGSAPSI